MTRDDKVSVVAETRERFTRATVALLATNRGLSVADATRLRRTVREAGGELKVIKHRLVKRALPETRYAGLETHLTGPRALVFGYADPVSVTKALVDFAEKNEQKLAVEHGAVEGEVIDAAQIKALASMPGLPELRARIVALVQAPGSRLVSALRRPGQRLAGALEARSKDLESGEGPASSPVEGG